MVTTAPPAPGPGTAKLLLSSVAGFTFPMQTLSMVPSHTTITFSDGFTAVSASSAM